MHIAWYSEDKPFAVGYADGKLLIGSKEPLEKGAIVVIDAHKVIRQLISQCINNREIIWAHHNTHRHLHALVLDGSRLA